MLRNPVERAFSHFAMDKRFGYVNMPFETIFEHQSSAELSKLYYQQYIELGNYYPQIKRYVEIFPPEQIKIFLLEDMTADTPLFVKQLYKFLGVNEDFVPNVSEKFNPNVAYAISGLVSYIRNQHCAAAYVIYFPHLLLTL